jgi:hypothetical protein
MLGERELDFFWREGGRREGRREEREDEDKERQKKPTSTSAPNTISNPSNTNKLGLYQLATSNQYRKRDLRTWTGFSESFERST